MFEFDFVPWAFLKQIDSSDVMCCFVLGAIVHSKLPGTEPQSTLSLCEYGTLVASREQCSNQKKYHMGVFGPARLRSPTMKTPKYFVTIHQNIILWVKMMVDDASMVAHRSTNLMYFFPIHRYVDFTPVL